MRIAIVGSGISGLVAAYRLSQTHDVTVFESNRHIGGHTHTHTLPLGGRCYAVDSGFIVFNDWTYPNFIRLLEELGVEHQPSSMSFSVTCARTGLEYNGTSLNSLFAQRRNLFNPKFARMLWDIVRFNRHAPPCLPLTTTAPRWGITCVSTAIRRPSPNTTSCPWARRSGRPARNTC
jgi:predicted NAD/FAD-binding protein